MVSSLCKHGIMEFPSKNCHNQTVLAPGSKESGRDTGSLFITVCLLFNFSSFKLSGEF